MTNVKFHHRHKIEWMDGTREVSVKLSLFTATISTKLKPISNKQITFFKSIDNK